MDIVEEIRRIFEDGRVGQSACARAMDQPQSTTDRDK